MNGLSYRGLPGKNLLGEFIADEGHPSFQFLVHRVNEAAAFRRDQITDVTEVRIHTRYADGKNLGGRAVLQVGPRDSEPKWQIASQGLLKGPLRVEIRADEIGDSRQFDVRVVLRSTSGVEHGSKACATLRSLIVRGR